MILLHCQIWDHNTLIISTKNIDKLYLFPFKDISDHGDITIILNFDHICFGCVFITISNGISKNILKKTAKKTIKKTIKKTEKKQR